MVGQQIGVLAQAIRRTLDLHHDGVMQQAIEQRRSNHAIAKHLTPFTEAAVGSEDDGAPLVTRIHELEEQIAAVRADREVPDFVDDQQAVSRKESHTLREIPLAFGLGHRGNDFGKRAEVDALAGAHGLDAKRDAKMRFPCPGGPRK